MAWLKPFSLGQGDPPSLLSYEIKVKYAYWKKRIMKET
jgi:hypothetical protein